MPQLAFLCACEKLYYSTRVVGSINFKWYKNANFEFYGKILSNIAASMDRIA